MVSYILITGYSIVIYEPIEFQIPASACSSILHISHSFQKQKKRTKHYCMAWRGGSMVGRRIRDRKVASSTPGLCATT